VTLSSTVITRVRKSSTTVIAANALEKSLGDEVVYSTPAADTAIASKFVKPARRSMARALLL